MENNNRIQATLSLQNISMYYHSGNNIVPGIVGVNLEFRKGEFVVITGESGSGKSTLLNIISALSPYHDGEMYINGEETSAYSKEDWENYRREHIGFIFQDYNLIKSYTVLENVMSAVLLCGTGKTEAKAQAKKYIEQVGLGGLLHRKASKLSSGQKQRLAIARALAKDTDIIVADEPTGNLDSENGKQIVEILAALSKEKLVIMVSHNVEEAVSYATRRVRIHASHVVADQKLRENAKEVVKEKAAKAEENKKGEKWTGKESAADKASERKAAWRLALLNEKAQPIKAILVICFMLLCTLASGIFAAGYLASSDDTATRIYKNGMFLNGSERRIVVVRQDGMPAGMEDVEVLRALRYVEQAELYDRIADINYYSIPEKDYVVQHSYKQFDGEWEGPEAPPSKSVQVVSLKNHSKFMKSATCVALEDLAAGKIPKEASEIIYGSNPELIGTTMEIAVSDRMHWGDGTYGFLTFTIVGVLKETDGQVYFSEEFCQALIVNDGRYKAGMIVSEVPFVVWGGKNETNISNPLILLPDSNLSPNRVQISDVWLPVGTEVKEGDLVRLCIEAGSLPKEQREAYIEDEDVTYDEVLKLKYVSAEAASALQNSSGKVQLVSPEIYQKLFCIVPETKQMTLYIKDYAYMDDVLYALHEKGYLGLSPLRASSLEYDREKVTEQLITLLICMAAFISVYFIEVFILRTFMKFKKGDYQVLHSIGMTQCQMKQMVCSEFMLSAAVAIGIAGVVAMAAWLLLGDIVYDLMKYLRWYHYIALVVLEFAAVFVLANSYSSYLRKQFGAASARKSR